MNVYVLHLKPGENSKHVEDETMFCPEDTETILLTTGHCKKWLDAIFKETEKHMNVKKFKDESDGCEVHFVIHQDEWD